MWLVSHLLQCVCACYLCWQIGRLCARCACNPCTAIYSRFPPSEIGSNSATPVVHLIGAHDAFTRRLIFEQNSSPFSIAKWGLFRGEPPHRFTYFQHHGLSRENAASHWLFAGDVCRKWRDTRFIADSLMSPLFAGCIACYLSALLFKNAQGCVCVWGGFQTWPLGVVLTKYLRRSVHVSSLSTF